MAEYDPKIALGLAEYSNLAYFRKEMLKNHFERADVDFKFEFLKGEGELVDTQGFMITEAKGMIVAFRGTQQPLDVATNLWLVPTLNHSAAPSSRVHKGFCTAYEKVRDKILDEIKDREPARVFVTGHSLGGAIATFAALDIAQKHRNIKVTMYNFGSPPVGDWGFAGFYNSKVDDSFRVVMWGDPVPGLPLLGFWPAGYRHVDHERRLRSVALPFLHHDLVQSYLPQLSDATSGQSFFD